MDKEAASKHSKCAFCRANFSAASLVSLNPLITRLERSAVDSAWTATVVDASRKPLEERVVYHIRCGCFYNLDSFRKLGGADLPENASLTASQLPKAVGRVCHGCWALFANSSLRLVFTTGTEGELDTQEFEDLATIRGYGILGMDNAHAAHSSAFYIPPWSDEEGASRFLEP